MSVKIESPVDVRRFVPLGELRKHLVHFVCGDADGGLGKVVRQSEYIELDRAALQFERLKSKQLDQHARQYIETMRSSLDASAWPPQTLGAFVDLLSLNAAVNTVKRIDRVYAKMLWEGNIKNSVKSYVEFDGLNKQLAGQAKFVEFSGNGCVYEELERCKSSRNDLKWCVVIRPQVACNLSFLDDALVVQDSYIPEQMPSEHVFSSSIYILPLSEKEGDGGVFARRTEPEFLWSVETSHWDSMLICISALGIEIGNPELATVIVGFEVDYSKYMTETVYTDKKVWL